MTAIDILVILLRDYNPKLKFAYHGNTQALDAAIQALYEHIIELIGEDENVYRFTEIRDPRLVDRNELRAELRQKLKEYFGHDSKGQED